MFSVASKRKNTCKMSVFLYSSFFEFSVFKKEYFRRYIFRTNENSSGSCQPCSNNIHIYYDNTAAH